MNLLASLEAETVQIIREVFSRFSKIGVLYAGGKDSSVLLHLMKKALFPTQPAFDMIHVDSGRSCQTLLSFIDKTKKLQYAPLKIHSVADLVAQDGNFTHFPMAKLQLYVLRQALRKDLYEVMLSGTRNQESNQNLWRPAFQRMKFDNPSKFDQDETDMTPHRGGLLHPGGGEFFKVHPLSRWTERDIWSYIRQEKLPVLSLYYGIEHPKTEKGIRIRSLSHYYRGLWLESIAKDPETVIEENHQLDLHSRATMIREIKRRLVA